VVKRGERIFEGGVLEGHYGMYKTWNITDMQDPILWAVSSNRNIWVWCICGNCFIALYSW